LGADHPAKGVLLPRRSTADSIASFARSKKRHDAVRFAQAIRDWGSDLGHLHRTYCVGRFGFGWPTHPTADKNTLMVAQPGGG
jgi:hypothetical protein